MCEVQTRCRGADEEAGAELQRCRCRVASKVQLQRYRQGSSTRYRVLAEFLQSCRGAEEQRSRGAGAEEQRSRGGAP